MKINDYPFWSAYYSGVGWYLFEESDFGLGRIHPLDCSIILNFKLS
jgi:hypothetical protein